MKLFMKIVLFFLVLIGASNASLIIDIIKSLNPELLTTYFPIGKAAASNCVDTSFNHCQYNFNSAIGINTALNWRNGSSLQYQVDKVSQASLTSFVNVCAASTKFLQCLGTSFYSCIDPFALMQRPNADYSQVLQYSNIWNHLFFTCNSGFEIITDMETYNKIVALGKTQGVQNCMTNFQSGMASNPNGLCSNGDVFIQCMKTQYDRVSKQAGWALCEDARVGFASNCPNLRCYV
ncbi:Aspartic peptidase domain-containing protein [Strongyloides ratti]|uniref:Aspartic peptidase domain-containing protein n=1 Tax=Strongyloides ratti TaxID=34506 RepID=A0A090LFK2_STRRB|nr:Aspartic peptidase domain-containing protein [Strongyloides ratti]CEF68571.1 Aspartic peptidase domain-containing protein [Strongyloides ratti]